MLSLLAWVGEVALFGATRALRSGAAAVRVQGNLAARLRNRLALGTLIALSGFAIGVVLSMHTRARSSVSEPRR